ncbi:MAG: hypothetical protein K6B41_14760, partial [Butyrivibrio sp.]|nr:hypothetical protein [Butyrivibrio sp.]
METESIKKDKSVLFYIGLFVFSGLLSFTASYLYEKTFEEILRNVLVNLMTTGTVIFMLNDIDPEDTFLYGNIHRKIIFVLIFMGEMTMAAVMPSINFDAWPYMVLFVILALFSNPFIGIFSGASLVMFSELLSVDTSYYEFFIYFVAGSIAIALFRDLTEETKIGLPLFISMLMQLILLLAFHVLFLNSSLTPSIVIVPVVNVFINMILLTILLNFVGVFFIRKSNDMYMDINDTEFKLLVDIKDKNKDEYFRAIHTAYLAERAAMDIGINARV